MEDDCKVESYVGVSCTVNDVINVHCRSTRSNSNFSSEKTKMHKESHTPVASRNNMAMLQSKGEGGESSKDAEGRGKAFLEMNDDAFPILVHRGSSFENTSSSSTLNLAAIKSETAALGGEWATLADQDHRPLYARSRLSRLSSENMNINQNALLSSSNGSNMLKDVTGSDFNAFTPTKSTPPKGNSVFADSMVVSSMSGNAQTMPPICKHFSQGYCARGDLCPNLHTSDHIKPVAPHPAAMNESSVGLYYDSLGTNTANHSNLSMTMGTQHSNMYPMQPPLFDPANPQQSLHHQNSAYFPYPMYPVFPGQMPGMFAYPNAMGVSYSLENINGTKGKSRRHRRGISSVQSIGTTEPVSSPDDTSNKYAGKQLEDLQSEIIEMCRDQHGCRFLQKRLEEGRRKYINLIFTEVIGQIIDLMTDPFGNYLCQKLLEYCGDEQRTVIVETVAPEIIPISFNMHGTRAIQKMIEFLSNAKQIRVVVTALSPHVVTLIKDLNGNHVIQKCLNRLSSSDNQFIYDAVSENCIEVSTHRHGCCVMQRCIDHAIDQQRVQLAEEITKHALVLVQDPFGNYVIQYVLDLLEPRFNEPLIRRFYGQIVQLSMQKFSSNVVEKCIRVCDVEARRTIIDEMIARKDKMDRMLRDSYANYVVQTALDCAEPLQRARLVECLRPLLPAVRNTPYGKRIQAKLYKADPTQHVDGGLAKTHSVPMPIPVPLSGVNGQGAYMAYPVSIGMQLPTQGSIGMMHPAMMNMPGSLPFHHNGGMQQQQQFGVLPVGHSSHIMSNASGAASMHPSVVSQQGMNFSTSPSTGAFLPVGMFPSSPPLPPKMTPPSATPVGTAMPMMDASMMTQSNEAMSSVSMTPMGMPPAGFYTSSDVMGSTGQHRYDSGEGYM